MELRDTPTQWCKGFRLYRRKTGTDALGGETAFYDMSCPDEEIPRTEGIAFRAPRIWGSAGSIGSAGATVQTSGEQYAGVLEACLRRELELTEFDRLEVDGMLYEVRLLRRWPNHREILLQRVG